MDMLLGMPSIQASAPDPPLCQPDTLGLILDNWHVTPRLTLQLGIRYDALPHAWERNNQVANFDPSAFLASATPFWNRMVPWIRQARASRPIRSWAFRLLLHQRHETRRAGWLPEGSGHQRLQHVAASRGLL